MQESKRNQSPSVTVVMFVIAVLGVVVPILWDIMKSKTSLELRETSRTTLAERMSELDKLEILYDGEKLDQLLASTFTLANTGREPIRITDIVSPPTLIFMDSTCLIDAYIKSMYPTNLDATLQLDKHDERVSVTFPLLNPGDNLTFVVLTASIAMNYEARARIVGFDQLAVVSEVREPSRTGRRVPWTVYPVGFFAVVCLIGAITLAMDIPSERRCKRAIASKELVIPENGDRTALILWVQSLLSWTTAKERKPLLDLLHAQSNDGTINEDVRREMHQLILAVSSMATRNAPTALLAVVLALIGIGYVLLAIF